MLRTTKLRIFLLSLLVLFLELSLIRFIPANIILVGYFANLILLGSFLGIGIGMLLARYSISLITLFPSTLLLLITTVAFFKFDIDFAQEEILYFTTKPVYPTLPFELVLSFFFLLTALAFIPLSQELGKLFKQLKKPLLAYTIDILGSLSGIILFSFLSFLSTPAYVWFLLIALLVFALLPKLNRAILFLNILLLIPIFLIPFFINIGSFWSPYSKITVKKNLAGYVLNANNTVHQYIGRDEQRLRFYFTPYLDVPANDYKKILIIGAGSGSDVSIAVARSKAGLIDAVEIDPKIAEIGKKLHPNKPYDNPRVHLHINDGRNFLETNKEKYDLIIFAITDSLTLSGNHANIRLETFLYTQENFQLVKNSLSENGLFVIYNFFPTDWAFDKVASMLENVFGYPAYFKTYDFFGGIGLFMTGPKSQDLITKPSFQLYKANTALPLPQDDWPFFYLKERKLPESYARLLVLLAFMSTAAIFLALGKKSKIDIRFFLFGAAFMLLETKSLVTFALLFGNTWMVNSLVFVAILSSILLANLISFKVTIKTPAFLYILLILTLLFQYFTPIAIFSGLPAIFKYVLASIFYFSPIFFANIIFSQYFKKTKSTQIAFGSNILGALFGGLVEYVALITGYKALLLIVMFFYVLSLIRFRSLTTK